MKRKKLLLFSLIIFCTSVLNAQLDSELVGSRDTIFVYDTLFVMDTIRLLRSSSSLKELEKLSPTEVSYIEVKNANSNEKLFIFSNGQTATLSDSDINSVNNNFNSKNSDEMKKIGFLGVMLFAFQNMVLAQNDIGVYLGSGAYNLLVLDEPNTNFVPAIHLGISYQEPFANGKLFYDIKLNYSYLSQTSFDSVDSVSVSFIEFPLTGPIVINSTPTTTIKAVTIDYHCNILSLPLTLGLNGGGFRPFIGIEPYWKDYQYISRPIDTAENNLTGFGVSSGSIGANAIIGFQIPFSNRFALNASYARQFTVEEVPNIEFSPNKDVQFQRLDLTLRYRLFKKEDKPSGN